ILRQLSDQELEGVIAHELAHIKNRDILTSSVAATMAGAITYLAYFAMFFGGRDRNPIVSLLLFLLAPLAATVIQMAISRSREYAADKEGAAICRNPQALASALDKLARGVEARPMQQAEASTAHMFIANPFSGGLKGLQSLFSTHPPMDERIRRLQEM
ncbi:MAG: M48 family metalloprotease, partial [Bacteroidetes bacterium]|nr:M48 family metalloprotease [Bacteroidota bacterium]